MPEVALQGGSTLGASARCCMYMPPVHLLIMIIHERHHAPPVFVDHRGIPGRAICFFGSPLTPALSLERPRAAQRRSSHGRKPLHEQFLTGLCDFPA